MTIDFHAHVFPDKVAEKAISILYKNSGYMYEPVHDGTVAGLLGYMGAAGVDVSVNLPVVMKPSQTRSVNEWAAGIRSKKIIGFGGVHPQTADYKSEIDHAAALGLKGLKFHAEYQDFFLDDPHMLKIYDYALGKGLIVLHHAGYDPAFKPPFKSDPRRFRNVADAMRGGVIVAAHLGGHGQWDEVEDVLAGSGIYLDTSMGFEYFSRGQFVRIVKKHGADKILFASDSPWSDAKKELETLRSLPLAESEIQAVAGGNARRILGI